MEKAAEKRLTGFTRSARVLGVALATAVDARTVRRARNRTADDESGGARCLGHSVQFAAGLIALDSAPTGFAVAFTAAVRSVPAAQNRANTCDTKKRNDPVSVLLFFIKLVDLMSQGLGCLKWVVLSCLYSQKTKGWTSLMETELISAHVPMLTHPKKMNWRKSGSLSSDLSLIRFSCSV